jgi:hypothetical protein
MPVADGVRPNQRPSKGKSLPIAVAGKLARIYGTEFMTAATNVLEFGPGKRR